MTRKNEKQKMWTHADEKKLIHMRTVEGASAKSIAAALGRKISAVETRISRLKLKKAITVDAWSPDKRPSPPKRHPLASVSFGVAKDLVDIKEGECRFPVHGTNKFCAAACKGTYCEDHASICYA